MKKFLVIILFCMLLVSCTDEEKQYIVDNYGGKNAYIEYQSYIRTLDNPLDVVYSYKSSISTINASIEYACNEVSNYDGIVFSCVQSTSLNGPFKIDVIDTRPTYCPNPRTCNTQMPYLTDASGNPFATNLLNSPSIENYGISSSTITVGLDDSTMSFPEEVWRYIFMHEMGHTLGLDDLDYIEAKGNSIMYYKLSADDLGELLNTFTEFDSYNINWHYRDGNDD